MKISLFTFIFFFAFASSFAQQQAPAFPTAEGYGMWVTGGRGGRVVHVTNLEDTDRRGNVIEGSFRAAMKTEGDDPITIVFDVSGTIQLNSELRSSRSNITIAGQTAPGDGICIKGGSVNLGGSDNLITRHIRFRVGTTETDGFIEGACLNIENAGYFIIDHCSFSWSAEENTGFYNNQGFTVQWCIMAEGLYNAGHPKGARGYGSVWGGELASYHHNLLAHNYSRSPRFGTSDKNDLHVLLDFVNNVNYNFGKANACYGGENEMGSAGSVTINFVNNYFKPGPAYPGTRHAYFARASYEIGIQDTYYSSWHLSGNHMEGPANTNRNTDNYSGLDVSEYQSQISSVTVDDLKSDHHDVPYPVGTQTAADAYNSVADGAGAFPRDSMDIRIIHELRTGTASGGGSFNNHGVTGIVDRPSDSGGYPTLTTYHQMLDSDVDGIPNYWEAANDMDSTNAEDRNNLSAEGYTFLEVYLNGIVGEKVDGFVFPEPVYIGEEDTTVLASADLTQSPAAYIDATGQLHILNRQEISNVALYNLSGNHIRVKTQDNNKSLTTTGLKAGVYILKIENKDGSIDIVRVLKI